MTTEQQNKAWACLSKGVRSIIRVDYKNCYDTPNSEFHEGSVDAYKETFGKHNLTSDTEPEEKLMVEKKKAQSICNRSNDKYRASNEMEQYGADLVCSVFEELFGDKCLPDKFGEEVNFPTKSDKEEQAKPKFKVGDKVICLTHNRSIGKIEYISPVTKLYQINRGGTAVIHCAEQDLEPYIEESKSKFEVGDKVKVLNDVWHKVYRVNEVKCIYPQFSYRLSCSPITWFAESTLEPYTEEKNEPIASGTLNNPLDVLESYTTCTYNTTESVKEKNMEETKRKDWSESFEQYAKEGEDEKLLPDFLDSEAIDILDKEKELNLCELLKGCKGEEFYSPTFGKIKFVEFINRTCFFTVSESEDIEIILSHNGKWCRNSKVISAYPSEELYEKYPFDPYSAWMEWKKERRKYILEIFIGSWFDGENGREDANYNEPHWLKFDSKKELDQAAEEVRKTLESFHKRKEGEK